MPHKKRNKSRPKNLSSLTKYFSSIPYRNLTFESLESRRLLAFAAPVNYEASGAMYGLSTGDFNADGITDLASGDYGQGRLEIFLGRGNGTFRNPTSYFVGGNPNSVISSDIDGDGHLDLTIGTYSGRQVVILFGNGDGTFANLLSWTNTSRLPVEVAVADMNGDGLQDLISSNYSHGAGSISVILASGFRQFASPLEFVSGNGTTGLAIADFNGDSQLDVATSDYQAGTVSILLNSGAGILGNRTAYETGSLPSRITHDDFNGDGAIDLAVANYGSNELIIHYGNGNGTLQTPLRLPAVGSLINVKHGDFNGDRFTDFVVSMPDRNSIGLFSGGVNSTYEPAIYFPTGTNPIGLAVADFDGNGTMDVATANFVSRDVSLLKNLASPANPHLTLDLPSVIGLEHLGQLTVAIRDESGRIRSDFIGQIEFGGAALAAGLPASYMFTNADAGIKSFNFTFSSLGEKTVSARIAGQTSMVAGQSIRVLSSFSVDSGGTYRVPEESLSILQGSVTGRSATNVTFTWDLDGDNIFGETGTDATRGAEISATPIYVTPAVDADRRELIKLRVTDADGLVAESTSEFYIYNLRTIDTPVPIRDETRASQAVWPNRRVAWENTKISANASGRKVVTWSYDYGASRPFSGVQARIFDADNKPLTGDIRVQSASGIDDCYTQGVSMFDDGSFAVVWQRWGGDAQGWGIRARVFHPNGTPRTDEFLVNTSIQSGWQSGANITALANNRFAVTWQDPNSWVDGSGNSIIGKVFGLDGEVYASDRIMNDLTTGDQFSRKLAGTADGGFVMLYSSNNTLTSMSDVYVRRFDSNANPIGQSTRVSPISNQHQYAGGLAVSPNGSFLVSWKIESSSTQQDVFIRRFNQVGEPISAAVRVNSFFTGNQTESDVAVDVTGEYVVSWNSDEQDGSLQSVYARRIDALGVPVGAEFRVNNYTIDAQWGSSVDFGAPGELLFSWKSEGQFNGYSAAMMRSFEMVYRNLPPVAIAGGPYAVTEGESVTLSSALSSDPNGDLLSYSWDVNGDGQFGDATGVTPTLSWPQLKALGIDGTAVYNVRVQVSDGVNPTVISPIAHLNTNNLAPTIQIDGQSQVHEGASFTLNLGPILEPGSDTISQIKIRWGDGTSTELTETGLASHVYQDGHSGPGSASSISVTEIVVADTMVNDASSFGGPNIVHGSRSTLWATNWFNPGAGGSLASYPLFKFDLRDLAFTQVDGDAIFRVYLLGPTTSSHHFGTPRRVDLYQITSPWNEATTTYANRPSATYVNSKEVVYFGNDRWVEWKVPQSILQGWLDHPESNHGLMLVNELPDSFYYDLVFAAREFGQGLQAQLIFNATGPLRIHVDLIDEDGFFPSAGTHEVTVLNVAPSGSVSGPVEVVPFQPFQLTLFASDPSPVDQAAGFRFEIDWHNDGVFDEVISNAASGVVVSSSINTLGPRVIRVRVVDKDGGSSEFQHTILVRPFYAEGELFVGGTEGNDAIIIRQGVQPDTLSVLRNGTPLGTFATQSVRVFAGPGTDSVLVEGNNNGNIITAEANKITTDTIGVLSVDTERWSIHGQAGNDTIIVHGGTVEVLGGTGIDTLISKIVAASTWNISALNAGALRANNNQFTFTGVENLKGSESDDSFVLSNSGRISGRLMGEGGYNTIDYGTLTTPVLINLQSNTASHTGGFANINAFVGGLALDTFAGPNHPNVWEIQSDTRTRLNQVNLLDNFEVLSGGFVNDEFIVDPLVLHGPGIVGGAGLDVLNYSRRTDDIVVNRQLRTATAIASFDTLESYIGGLGRDTWIGPDAVTTWTVSDTQIASISGSTMNGFEHLHGGRFADSFLLTTIQADMVLSGGDGDDFLTGPNTDMEWELTGDRSGTLSLGHRSTFREIENLRGGTSVDRWIVGVNATGFRSINGNAGIDVLDYSLWRTPIQFDATSRSANGIEQFSLVETVIGGSKSDRLVGPSITTTYILNGQDSILANGVQFRSTEELVAGPENDTFSFESADAGISGFIDAGSGMDSLIGFNIANDWKLTGFRQTLVNAATEVWQIENILGGSASDTFTVFNPATGFNSIGGGAGRDTLDYSAFDAPVTLNLASSTAVAIATFTSIENVIGSTFSDAILGSDSPTRWSLSGRDEGSVGNTSFMSFENLIGGSAFDEFTLTSNAALLTGIADGGLGADQITAFAMENTWDLTGAQSGNLNNVFTFRGVENLFGTSANDTFRLRPMAGDFNIVDGSNGVDTVDYSDFEQEVTVSLRNSSSTGIAQVRSIENWIGTNGFDRFVGSNTNVVWLLNDKNTGKAGSIDFRSFEELYGGTGMDTFRITSPNGNVPIIDAGTGIDTLVAANLPNNWSITSPGVGTLNDVMQFKQFENLTGGGLNDVFTIGNTGSIPGTLSGGGGANSLSYETWTTPVTVNQIIGKATSIANLAPNFQTIIGGEGDDLLIAFSMIASILVGNAGNDRLVGSASRDILIGGEGADILQGLAGDDILLSGWSVFDARPAALRQLHVEWSSTRPLSERINNLRGTGTPLNHGFYLTQATGRRTIFNDGALDQIYGGTSNDWFISSTTDELLDRLMTEYWEELT